MLSSRQQEIIDESINLIAEKGIQGLTIKNLSLKLGISEPAIYRHFDNKISILTTIIKIFRGNISQIFQSEINASANSIDKIEHLFNKHFITFSNRPVLTSVVFSEEIFRNEKSLIDEITAVIESNKSILVEIIQIGQKNNEIRNDIDAEDLAIMLLGSLRLFVKRWRFENFNFDIKVKGLEFFQSLKKLLV